MKGLTWRIWTVVVSIVFSVYLLFPTYLRYAHGIQISKIHKADDPWYFRFFPSETLKLGLDLSGGLHLVLGIDFNEVKRDATTKLKNQIKEVAERAKIEGIELETTNDHHVIAKFASEEQWRALDKAIGAELGQYVDFVSKTDKSANFKLTSSHETEVNHRAIDQALETLRNRIDEFGIAEPIIQRQGEDKIMVQFPGVQETGRLKEIISRTAKLSFQIVRSGPEVPEGPPRMDELQSMVDDFVKTKALKLTTQNPITKYLKEVNAALESKLPKNTEILFHKKMNVNTREAEYIPYVVDRESLVTGEDLQDAFYGFDPNTNEPIVNFQLTPIGANKFERATGENVGRMMAIVLDSNVHSAPRIKSRIGGGRAMIEMGSQGRNQQELQQEAKDTSLVLRSGALPARLEFLEERIVGPSLGLDAIRSGTLSLIAGLALVFIFISIYYRRSGWIANFALSLNGLFILAFMAAFEGTLTLPGLAGITLTLGMAIDANVLIFEHVREELRLGKPFLYSLKEGYRRAFTAIFDSHVTSIIAAVVLLSFGYGPIRGFAVTLLIGLAASLYTAVFVTHVVFDVLMLKSDRKALSI